MKNDNQILKESIKHFKEQLCLEFNLKKNITTIINQLIVFIDKVLINLFIKNKLDKGNSFCLIALGSYGRRELLLHSDIDLLILHKAPLTTLQLQRAQTC
ncbi:MAG: DUF294 nucleotidyltransferase-like domain-containing protein, partial [bacterium]|nr:DUF294 nucleotidyltransferase-like domain-containing protein [bacterium]